MQFINTMRYFLSLLIAICAVTAASAQVKVLKPEGVFIVPDISADEYVRMYEMLDSGTLNEETVRILESSPLYSHFYSPGCSWYCGGSVAKIYASSCLSSQGSNTYYASNLHDFNHETAWVEGVSGHGIGQYIVYEFEMQCPRITTINILNGYVKNYNAWKANSRVKKLKVYYNNTPIAILELEDSRSLQWFDIGVVGRTGNGPRWSLKFEIIEVYPGSKYPDTVISEIYFDGIDVH